MWHENQTDRADNFLFGHDSDRIPGYDRAGWLDTKVLHLHPPPPHPPHPKVISSSYDGNMFFVLHFFFFF